MTDTLDSMDTETEISPEEAAFKADYPAVTQVAGRAIRYAPMEAGQYLAIQSLDPDDEGVTREKVTLILATLEGCIGPRQYQAMILDMARKKLEEDFPIKLFIKIMDRARRDVEKAEPTP